MTERRIADRQRIDETASIAVDEHSSIGCLIYDVSRDGVRLVALDLHAVPTTFVLSAQRFAEAQVCEVVWRRSEEIGARFRTPAGDERHGTNA